MFCRSGTPEIPEPEVTVERYGSTLAPDAMRRLEAIRGLRVRYGEGLVPLAEFAAIGYEREAAERAAPGFRRQESVGRTVACANCGGEFETRRSYMKYCGWECANRAAKQKKKKRGVIREQTCPVCKKVFVKNATNQKYCGKACYIMPRRATSREKKTCPGCETIFTPQHGLQKYCNSECHTEVSRVAAKERYRRKCLATVSIKHHQF